jgi:hypothetical protein
MSESLPDIEKLIREIGDMSDGLLAELNDAQAVGNLAAIQRTAERLKEQLAATRRIIDRELISAFGHERDALRAIDERANEVEDDLGRIDTAIEPIVNPTGYGSRVRHSDDRPIDLKRAPGAHTVYR